ncbi:MAG: transporter [Bacteroidota bacterium]
MCITRLLILLCFVTEGFSQGPIDGFYRGKGNLTSVMGFGFEDNQNYLIGITESDLSRTLVYTNLFSAFGLSEDLDAQVSIPYMASDDNQDFQDLSLFLKYRFVKVNLENSRLDISLGLGFSTPLSDYDIGGLNDIGQQATIFDSRLVLHYQLENGWFGTATSGYSLKLEEVPNSFPLILKVGKAAGKWYYDVFYDFQNAIDGIDYRGTPSPQNFRELEVDYHKIGTTLFRNISGNFGAYINYSNVFAGRNVFQGSRYSLGVVWDFKKK